MSTINRLLSRRDKHTHGSRKEKVMPSPESPPTRGSTPASASLRSRHNSSSSLSLAFPGLQSKQSPRLQATIEIVECSCADLGTLILQPKPNGGVLKGLFVADEERKSDEKDEDRKVRGTSSSSKEKS